SEGAAADAGARRLLSSGSAAASPHLTLSFARSRAAGGRGSRRRSRFLEGIWPEEGSGGRRVARGPRTTTAPTTPDDVDDALLERLRTWRAQVADRIDKPAFAVLHDS